MNNTEALTQIEAALNAATQKGVFADLQSAALIFGCLQQIKNAIGNDSNGIAD